MKLQSHFGKQQGKAQVGGGGGGENEFVRFHMAQKSSPWIKIVHFYHSKSCQILEIIDFSNKNKKAPDFNKMLTLRG